MSDCFCSFGKFHVTYIFPFLMGVFYSFRQIMGLLLKYHQDDDDKHIPKGLIKGPGQHHFFYTTAIMFLGESIITFLFIIAKTRADRKNISHKNILSLIPGNTFKEKLKLGLIIIPLFLIDVVLSTFSNYLIFKNSVSLDQLNKMVLIILNIPLNYYFFNTNYYKHHYIGLFVTGVGLIIYTFHSIQSIISDKNNNSGEQRDIWFEIIAALLSTASTAFHNVWEKILMDKHYFHPYSLIGLQGIYGLIFSVIVLGILNCFKWSNPFFCDMKRVGDSDVLIYETCQSFKSLKRLFTTTNYIWVITVLYTLGFTSFNIFRMLANQNFSTTHRCISDCFGAFFIWICKEIVDRAYDKEKSSFVDIAFGIVSYLFILFGVIVFLEFVILNCCNLNRDTSYMISTRGDEENPEFSIKYKFLGAKGGTNSFTMQSCEMMKPDSELFA